MGTLVDWLLQNEPSFRKSRLPSLYSDLTIQKTTNPEGYAANITTWQSALTAATLAGWLPSGDKLTINSSDELLDALASPQYGKPSGLGLVLDESMKARKMLDLKDFMNAEASIYNHSWIPSPWSILRWGIAQTGLLGNSSYNASGHLRSGQLVVVAALEQFSAQTMSQQEAGQQSLTDRIMTRDDFSQMIKASCKTSITKQEEEILLKYMSRDKQLLNYDGRTVKFRAKSSPNPEPISSEDATIASLKSLTSSLETQTAELDKRSEALRVKAMSAVQNKNRQMALSALKSRKLVERTLQQRTDTLHQLEDVLSKIEQAVDQVQIVEVMQASASALKTLNNRTGGVEKVEDVVEDLREQMSKADEVGQVLQEPMDPNVIVDENEIDDELEAMEVKAREVQEQQETEVTRKRLEELEKIEKQNRVQESNLQSSIEQLERLDIAKDEINSGQQAEQIPAQTS